jgi:hypothetical protein
MRDKAVVSVVYQSEMVKVDQLEWKESTRAFAWELHPGRNRVELKIRNQAGVEGPISFLEVERGGLD